MKTAIVENRSLTIIDKPQALLLQMLVSKRNILFPIEVLHVVLAGAHVVGDRSVMTGSLTAGILSDGNGFLPSN
jgi:hypothetical protein